MADRFWVGGTGTWDAADTTHWSASSGGAGGASVPTSSDDVYFNQASNATGYTVTTGAAVPCRNLTVVGPASGNVTFANSSFGINIYGSFSLAATGITWSLSSGTLTFKSTSTGKTINTNGVALLQGITFDGVGGEWTLQGNLATGSTRTVALTNGSLNLNGYRITCGLFNNSNSNTRTLSFGSGGGFDLTGSGGTVLAQSTITNLTVNGTGVINLTYSGGTGTRTVNPGALAEGKAISLNVTGGTDTITSDAPTDNYTNLNFTGFKGTLSNVAAVVYGNLTLDSGMTLSAGTNAWTLTGTSGTKTITLNGKTLDFPLSIGGTGGTWQFADALTLGATRTLTVTGGTIKFKAGTVNTVGGLSTTGRASMLSTTPGSVWTLSKSSGSVSVSNTTIQDSTATGGATFTAYYDSGNADAGNNTGWGFSYQNSTAWVSRMMMLGVGA